MPNNITINYQEDIRYNSILTEDSLAGVSRNRAEQILIALAEKMLSAHSCDDTEVNIILCDNRLITTLNEQYRHKAAPTDVLSFSFDEEGFLGEVYISVEFVEQHDKMKAGTFFHEIAFLLIHGMLHLLGYDHLVEKDAVVMRDQENIFYSEFEKHFDG